MGYEHDRATMEAERNATSDAYFKARPWLDSDANRNIFDAGFERAWSLRQEEIEALKLPNNQAQLRSAALLR